MHMLAVSMCFLEPLWAQFNSHSSALAPAMMVDICKSQGHILFMFVCELVF